MAIPDYVMVSILSIYISRERQGIKEQQCKTDNTREELKQGLLLTSSLQTSLNASLQRVGQYGDAKPIFTCKDYNAIPFEAKNIRTSEYTEGLECKMHRNLIGWVQFQ